MEFMIPGCGLSRRARLSVIFVVAIVAHAIIAACIFLGKDKPRQVLVDFLIAELAVALVWIVIRMVSRCREGTSLRTTRSDGEPNTENDVNTKALVKNDDSEQSQASTKAAIQEEEEEPNETERKQIEDDETAGKRSQTDGTEAERKQIEDDEGARKRSQAEEGGRNAPDDDWLNCIVITIAVLLVIAGLASLLLGPTRPGPWRIRSARFFRLRSLRSSSARFFRLRLFWSTSRRSVPVRPRWSGAKWRMHPQCERQAHRPLRRRGGIVTTGQTC
jgi:hypothetical protein